MSRLNGAAKGATTGLVVGFALALAGKSMAVRYGSKKNSKLKLGRRYESTDPGYSADRTYNLASTAEVEGEVDKLLQSKHSANIDDIKRIVEASLRSSSTNSIVITKKCNHGNGSCIVRCFVNSDLKSSLDFESESPDEGNTSMHITRMRDEPFQQPSWEIKIQVGESGAVFSTFADKIRKGFCNATRSVPGRSGCRRYPIAAFIAGSRERHYNPNSAPSAPLSLGTA